METDADCCFPIQTVNFYVDMEIDLDEYDTSNFEIEHPLYYYY